MCCEFKIRQNMFSCKCIVVNSNSIFLFQLTIHNASKRFWDLYYN